MAQTVLAAPVRVLAGREVPIAGQYEIDAGHSTVGFEVRHLMLTRTRGVFHRFAGTIEVGEDISLSSVELAIEAESIDTTNPERDAHLRSNDFLGTPDYPRITFSCRSIRIDGDHLLVDGELSIRGVSQPVTLRSTFEGGMIDPWGNERIAFTATTQINREDWGITWNIPMDGSGLVVGKDVKITLEVEALRVG